MMDVSEVAKMMGVTTLDVESFLMSLANSMLEDGVEGYFLSAPEGERRELIEAYSKESARKAQDFLTSYLTNPMKKAAFDSAVAGLVFSK